MPRKKRKICVLTGTRAEYGLLKPVMRAIEAHPALSLEVIATGMHLDRKLGYTYDGIVADGFKRITKVRMPTAAGTADDSAISLGTGVTGMAKALGRMQPDFLVVLGDRTEALAGTLAAAYMNIPVAHLHGGDSARAGLDEPTRHAITKYAALHFPATRRSAERLKKMGEDAWRIRMVGAPCMDTILNVPLLSKKETAARFGVSFNEPVLVLVQHPVSTEPEAAGRQIKATLRALKRLKHPVVFIYPNSDAGGSAVIRELDRFVKLPYVQGHKSLTHTDYLSLLKHADVLVGNSSSGVIESAPFKLPVVNIGIRQEGRERANNVIDVPHNAEKIEAAVKRALSPRIRTKLKTCRSPYGTGGTGRKIADKLASVELSKKLIQKKLAY